MFPHSFLILKYLCTIKYAMDFWRKIILPAADLACKMPVLFLLQLEKASRHDCFFPCAFPQADVRPQTDGCNGLRYNLTSDIIESIFRTYPAGKSSVLHTKHIHLRLVFWLSYCRKTKTLI